MADHKEIKQECDSGYFDQSLIDPRLRLDTAEMYGEGYQTKYSAQSLYPVPPPVSSTAQASSPLTPAQSEVYSFNVDAIDMGLEREAVLPTTAYQSLDFIVGSDDMVYDESERLWLIGVQAGIGLGVTGAREAVLNEMTYENTVFSRPMQLLPSDPSPYDMRMYLGRRCMEGFDRRVADRISNQFVANSLHLIDIIVENGLTACLPEYGSPLPGTFAFFTDEDSARCHENSRIIDEALKQAGIKLQPKPGVDDDVGTGQPAPLTASFKGDCRFIGGLDMTQLTGTAALVANALNEKNRARYGGAAMPNHQYMSWGPKAAPDMSHLTEGLEHDHQGCENKCTNIYKGQNVPDDKLDAEIKA